MLEEFTLGDILMLLLLALVLGFLTGALLPFDLTAIGSSPGVALTSTAPVRSPASIAPSNAATTA
jgi:hypothetical protein